MAILNPQMAVRFYTFAEFADLVVMIDGRFWQAPNSLSDLRHQHKPNCFDLGVVACSYMMDRSCFTHHADWGCSSVCSAINQLESMIRISALQQCSWYSIQTISIG